MYGILIMGITIFLNKINVSKVKINFISGISLIMFVFITGFSPSVVRSGIMAGIGIIANILHKKSDILNNLSISLLITLIINPYNISSMSVLLSYGGVLRNYFLFRNFK